MSGTRSDDISPPSPPAGGDRLPHVYRVTKYDPADRDERGRYTGDASAESDRGPVEAAYLETVAAFAEESGVDHLAVREPEFGSFPGAGPLAGVLPGGLAAFHDGATVSVRTGVALVRAMLREAGLWCRLEVPGAFAAHVGWDQYLYLGSRHPCTSALARARSLGLFPERLDASPYDFVPDDPDQVSRPADDDFWARLRWLVAVHGTTLLEETPAANTTRWHRLTRDTVDAVRAGLAPRARLAVWTDPLTDVETALATLSDDGAVEILREDDDGRITGTVLDDPRPETVATRLAGARAATVLPLALDGRRPLCTAVLPDGDGVLRARWQTDATPGDRDWAFLRTLRRGQSVTGTVTDIANFGVTFVDIGGFTAMINLPELSRRPFAHPSDVVRVGQEITARILDVDMVRERVSLSLRPPREAPGRGGRSTSGSR
ncbi:S1 RNA-binding domain-containing protein [Streptomyces sedi]|uniref:S1 RNA-binding domain-containing protein n=1 Tax=Streptomyces sedi TaxID=555059 RepID=UPI001FE86D3B|nr:S1 RNA-binding domain-containing protein [Streptomyces sedi]